MSNGICGNAQREGVFLTQRTKLADLADFATTITKRIQTAEATILGHSDEEVCGKSPEPMQDSSLFDQFNLNCSKIHYALDAAALFMDKLGVG